MNDEVFVYKKTDSIIVFVSEVYSLRIGDSISFNLNQNHSIKRYRDKKLIYDVKNPVVYKTRKEHLFRPDNINCFNIIQN